MKGRKPKDERLKVLNGNAGKHRLTTSGSGGPSSGEAFTRGDLEKPDYLNEYESMEWERIVTNGRLVLSAADAGMVLVACLAYGRMRRARNAVIEHGDTYETENQHGQVMIRQRPEVAMGEKAETAYHRALAELGLSPVAHTRVKALPDDRQTELPGIARLLG
jgi:P27 family predicted phage terminase small subunit